MVRSLRRLADGQRALVERAGPGIVAAHVEQVSLRIERPGHARMRRAQGLLADSERSLDQRSGGRDVAAIAVAGGQVDERLGHCGMIGTEASLLDLKRALVARLGPGIVTRAQQEQGEIVQAPGEPCQDFAGILDRLDVEVIRGQHLLSDGQRSLEHRPGARVVPHLHEQNAEV